MNLKNMTRKEMEIFIVENGFPKFRATQIFESIHGKGAEFVDDIKGIDAKLKSFLKENDHTIDSLKIVSRLDSKDEHTSKYLFLLRDHNIIESVWMKYEHGYTVCISTQVGCRMGCEFCASTKGGLVRNLSAGEILDQIYQIQKDLDLKINNVVLMGSGEPFDNYEELLRFLELVHDEKGQNMGLRHITVSTCGLVPKIYEFADLEMPVNLSISLHSPFDEERKKIMPIAKSYTIPEIMEACRYFFEKTGRRITFEYTLIQGVNDRMKEVMELAKLLRGFNAHINLIPLNEIKENEMKKSTKENVVRFQKELAKKGINATIRREMGSDIQAACGQLRKDYLEGEELS